jgi:hypothetical protein
MYVADIQTDEQDEEIRLYYESSPEKRSVVIPKEEGDFLKIIIIKYTDTTFFLIEKQKMETLKNELEKRKKKMKKKTKTKAVPWQTLRQKKKINKRSF